MKPSGNFPLSIVILTFNERSNIQACLNSCAWCDDVHVLDSGSTDGTVELALKCGAKVHHHPFTSFGSQRNWAIDCIATQHDWQFHLDADERFTSALQREITRKILGDSRERQYAAFYVPSKTIFLGRWLRFSAQYPTYQVRLFHRERCRFADFGHGQREITEGKIGTLREPYLHFNFSKGLFEWFAKHNRYSSLEARESLARQSESISWSQLRSSVSRRRTLKTISQRLPFRSIWRFVYSYGVRSGWRDGLPGFHYCLMMSIYEYLIELKVQELKRDADI